MLPWKYLMTPALSAERSHWPEWDQARARTAESWAWRIVSKLKVRPFQRVNSPLVEPVKMRRASGVNCGGRKGVSGLGRALHVSR